MKAHTKGVRGIAGSGNSGSGNSRSTMSGAYLSEAPFKCSTLGQAPALPENVTVDWKNFPGTNTPSYYELLKITDLKSFIILGPGHQRCYGQASGEHH